MKRPDVEWNSWYKQRPEDVNATYLWRSVEMQEKRGIPASVSFALKMQRVGMGLAEYQSWPEFSHWDGSRRSVPEDTEWALADQDCKIGSAVCAEGMFAECPICGSHPLIEFKGRYFTAPIWHGEYFRVRCCFLSVYRYNWNDLQSAWNRRSPHITALEAENARQAKRLDEMLAAIEAGQVTSAEIDLGSEIGPAPFHEVWASYVRKSPTPPEVKS